MITDLQLDKMFHEFNADEKSELDRLVLKDYPYPLAISYQNAISGNREPVAQLTILIKDTLSTVYQYLALLMLHDYANSEIPKCLKVYRAIQSMVYQPGPGKWLGFLREVRRHYGEQKATPQVEGVFDFLDRYLGKKSAKLKIVMSEGHSVQAAGALDVLVTLRNRWAHSRHMPEEDTRRITDKLLCVFQNLYRDLAFLADHPLVVNLPDGKKEMLKGVETPITGNRPLEVLLGDPAGSQALLRLFIHWPVNENKPELMLFEELIKDRQAVFSSSFTGQRLSRKVPEEAPIVESMLTILEAVRAEDELIGKEGIRYESLRLRARNASEQLWHDYVDAGKLDPETYVFPETFGEIWEQFLTGDEPILLSTGEQGRGKSALAAFLVGESLGFGTDKPEQKKTENTNTLIFLEAHRANALDRLDSILDQWFNETLGFRQDTAFLEYLKVAIKDAPPNSRIVFVVDAINEFETIRSGRSYTRRRLLEDLIEFADRADRIPELNGRVKVMLTLRWKAFEVMGYGADTFTAQFEDRTDLFFKRPEEHELWVEVPPLNDPGMVFERLRTRGQKMTPRFNWDQLPVKLRNELTNPMMMRIFLSAYHEKEIKELDVSTVNELSDRFVERLFLPLKDDSEKVRQEKKERSALVHDLMEEMKASLTQFVRLDPEMAESRPAMMRLLKSKSDRGRLNSDGTPAFKACEDLISQKVLREDIIWVAATGEEKTAPNVRLSFAHEILARFMLNAKRRMQDMEANRHSQRMILGLCCLTVAMLIGVSFANPLDRRFFEFSLITIQLLLIVPFLFFLQSQTDGLRNRFKDWVSRHQNLDDVIDHFIDYEVATNSITTERFIATTFMVSIAGFAIVFLLRLVPQELGSSMLGLPLLTANALPNMFSFMIVSGLFVLLLCDMMHHFLNVTYFGGEAKIQSETHGRAAGVYLSEFALLPLTLLALFPLMHLLIFLFGEMNAFMGYQELKEFGPAIRSLPFIGFPEVIILPFVLFLVIVSPRFIVGGFFLARSRMASRPGRPWPLDREVFLEKGRRRVKHAAVALIPAVVLAPVLVYQERLNLGELSIPVGQAQSFLDREQSKIVLSPKTIGSVDKTALVTDLNGVSRVFRDARTIELNGTSVSSIDSLSSMPKLEVLRLRHNTGLRSLKGVWNIQNLRELQLVGPMITNRIMDTLVTDSDPYQEERYFWLRLEDTSVISIALLDSVPSLDAVELRGNSRLDDVTALHGKHDLSSLILADNGSIGDLGFICNLIGLNTLVLKESHVDDDLLSCLTSLPDLNVMRLEKSSVSTLRPVLEFPSLGFLILGEKEMLDTETIKVLRDRNVHVEVVD